MFLHGYRSLGGGQGCLSVDTGPQEEDSGVSTWIQVIRMRTGVFVCRCRSSGGGQGCLYMDTGPQEEDRGVSL